MPAQRVRRKKYIVTAGFQVRYFLIIFFSILLFILVLSGNIYLILWNRLASGMIQSGLTDMDTVFRTAGREFLLRIVLLTTLLGCLSILLSHKIAGPIIRLESILERVRNRDISMEVRFRKNDEFKELARTTDELVSGLNEFLANEKRLISRLDRIVSEMKESGNAPPAADLERIVEEFTAHAESFKTRE